MNHLPLKENIVKLLKWERCRGGGVFCFSWLTRQYFTLLDRHKKRGKIKNRILNQNLNFAIPSPLRVAEWDTQKIPDLSFFASHLSNNEISP
jgi:hypothetical protein